MPIVDLSPQPAAAGDRNTSGGHPILDATPWPSCSCGTQMAFFFQLDVPAGHLLAFQCPVHNDAAFTEGGRRLPPAYWTGFWRFLLLPDGVAAAAEDPFIAPLRLDVRPGEDQYAFRIGGKPDWVQGEEVYECACGAPMEFLAQIPENFGFPKRAEAPPQPDSFSAKEYGLLLGNFIYLLACTARCNPAAIWPVNQN